MLVGDGITKRLKRTQKLIQCHSGKKAPEADLVKRNKCNKIKGVKEWRSNIEEIAL
jgi:hypothetical protein